MAVTLMCPNLLCRKVLMVPATARGTRVRCSYCGTVLFVPHAKPQSMVKSMSDLATTTAEDSKKSNKGKTKDKKV
jgi:LSD1 subclass zinc finger protein